MKDVLVSKIGDRQYIFQRLDLGVDYSYHYIFTPVMRGEFEIFLAVVLS